MPYYPPGVSPATVYQALLPLGKIGTSPGFLGGSGLYDPSRTLGAAGTGVIPVYWDPIGGDAKLGIYQANLSDPDATIAEMQAIDTNIVNFTAYEYNVGAGEIKMEIKGNHHAQYSVRATASQTLPMFQALDDTGSPDYVFAIYQSGRIKTRLPTADPHAVGVLWSNGGIVTVSAG